MALYCVVTPAELANAPRDASAGDEMHLIFFETDLTTVTWDGRVQIALIDGSMIDPTKKSECVALCQCERETAMALTLSLCSVLKLYIVQREQSDDEN